MLDLVGIDVYIVIFIMMKFQTLKAFYASSVQLLPTIPSVTQSTLCATQSYLLGVRMTNPQTLSASCRRIVALSWLKMRSIVACLLLFEFVNLFLW